MTHDPQCPFQPYQAGSGGTGNVAITPEQPAISCQCALIASVREEERKSHNRSRCTELDSIGHVDGRIEHISIAGEMLERRDTIVGEIETAIAEIDPAAVVYLPQVDEHQTLVFLGAVHEAIDKVRNAYEGANSAMSREASCQCNCFLEGLLGAGVNEAMPHDDSTKGRAQELFENHHDNDDEWGRLTDVRRDERSRVAARIPEIFFSEPFIFPTDSASIEFVQEALRSETSTRFAPAPECFCGMHGFAPTTRSPNRIRELLMQSKRGRKSLRKACKKRVAAYRRDKDATP